MADKRLADALVKDYPLINWSMTNFKNQRIKLQVN